LLIDLTIPTGNRVIGLGIRARYNEKKAQDKKGFFNGYFKLQHEYLLFL